MTMTQYLFAYGTLNDQEIQKQVFGRKLKGKRDTLVGFRIAEHLMMPQYQVAIETGNKNDIVMGMVYNVAHVDLYHADQYETKEAYKRILVTLDSEIEAWVYIENR